MISSENRRAGVLSIWGAKMGMYDELVFGKGNSILSAKDSEVLNSTTWQTKDLYRLLYRIHVVGNHSYYESGRANTPLVSLELSTEIVIYSTVDVGGESKFVHYKVKFERGRLVSATPWNPAAEKLPIVPEMQNDNDDWVAGVEHTISWLSKAHASKPWYSRLAVNCKGAMFEWRKSFEIFVKGLKRLFGMNLYK